MSNDFTKNLFYSYNISLKMLLLLSDKKIYLQLKIIEAQKIM